MEFLKGKRLLNCLGNSVPAERAYANKHMIAFFFSASWCEPTQTLMPKLKQVYQEGIKRKFGLEVIYVSSDTDEEMFLSHYKDKHAGWYAVPFNDPLANELRYFFDITNIPQIVVVRKEDDAIITRTGHIEIENLGKNVLVVWSN